MTDTPHSNPMTDTPHSNLMTDTPHSNLMTDTPHSTLMTDTPHSTLTTIVPQSTVTQILQHTAQFVCRAEYQAEINQHAEALKDCNTVLRLDSLCVAAYALRSRLSPPDDDEEEEEEEEKKEGGKDVELEGEDLGSNIPKTSLKRTAADKKAVMLASAASDALAAFLVGGSSDLSYASAAEEASRESCRVGARKIFEGRRREETKVPVLKGDSAASNEVETEGEKEGKVADSAPPRAWLVQSFFASYEPLRVAFGLENTPPEDDIEEEEGEGDLNTTVQSMYKDQMEAAATAEKSQDSSSSDVNGRTSNGDDDIDEGTKHPNTSLGLPSPPFHLSDSSCPLDPMAYWVLRRLVGRLEATREPGPEELAVVQANDEKLKSAGYTEVLGSWVGESQRMWEDLCAEEAEETAEEDCDTDVGEMKDERELESIKLDAEYTSILQRLDLLGGEDSDKNIGYSLGLKMGGRGSLQGDKPVSVPSLSSQDAARNAALSVSVAVQPVDVGEDFESDFAAFASSSDLLSHSDYTLSDPSSSSPSSTSASAGAATENVRRPVPRSAPPCPAFTWCLNLLRMPEVTAITGVTLSPIGGVVDIEGISPPSIQEEKAMKERQKEREEKEEAESAAEKSRQSSYGKSPWMRQQEEDEDEEDGEDGDEDENWEDCDDDEEEEDNEEGQGDDDNEWEDCDEEECDDNDESPESSTVREEDEITALRNSIRSVGMGWSAEGKKVNGKAPQKPVAAALSAAVDAAVKTTQSSAMPNGTDTSAASDLPIAAEPDATHTSEVSLSSLTPTPVRETSLPSSVPLSSPPLDRIVSSDTTIFSGTPHTAPPSAPVPVPEISTPVATSPPLKVSRSLRARLLSVCSSIAYLSGDALGAVKCLRASVQENLLAGKEPPPSMCPALYIFYFSSFCK
jgi:hypothetical protein